MSLWEKQRRSAGAWAAGLPHCERSHAGGCQGVSLGLGAAWLPTPPPCARGCSGEKWGEERKLCLRRSCGYRRKP